jgi:hypothetical protein
MPSVAARLFDPFAGGAKRASAGNFPSLARPR